MIHRNRQNSRKWHLVSIKELGLTAKSQIGAYHSLEYAKTCVDKNPGYSVFDEAGVNVYPENVFAPYMVRVKISDLKMRLGATIDTASVGHIPMGSYTIVEEKYGKAEKYKNIFRW